MPKQKATKNRLFHFRAVDQKGIIFEGDLEAPNLKDAKRQLQARGLFNIECKAKFVPPWKYLQNHKVDSKDITTFARQMATMLQSGIAIVQAFEIVAKGTENEAVHDLVMDLKRRVEQGSNFGDALSAYPQYFDSLFCTLVQVGELSGTLETMLDRVAMYKEKSESLRRKIKKALMYPTAVIIVAIIVTAILLIFVVPQFEDLFKSFGAELPAFTQMVIHMSEFVQKTWWLILLGGIAAFSIFRSAKRRSPKFRAFLDKWILKVPILGPILNKAIYARFARTLSTTFAAGLPLVEALTTVAKACGNDVYYQAVIFIQEELALGNQLNQAMRLTDKFPAMVVQLVAIGEESGSLDHMLERVAAIYEEEVDAAVDGLSSLLEPLIMVILGVLVGGLVVAMYLPIFQMGAAI